MRRQRIFPIKRQSEPGAAPGTIIAPLASMPSVIDLIAYGPSDFVEKSDAMVADILAVRGKSPVTWVNVCGLGSVEVVAQIAEIFGLHTLAIEDVMNLHQRPKVEEFEDQIFMVTQMFSFDTDVGTEQISMFFGSDYLLTFQEKPGDCLEPLRQRIRKAKGHVRSSGADYLAYAVMDAVVDEFFPVLESYGEVLEDLEEDVVANADNEHISRLHDMKRNLLTIRRTVWPLRDTLNRLIRDENPLVSKVTRVYLRDVYDHTVQLMDIIETFREIAAGLVDIYISSVSAKLNEIMKVLTIIATIFMPLGFIASLYGMNFDRGTSPWNMPELGWRFGYPYSLLLMMGIAAGLLFYFRRRGWIGKGAADRNHKH